MISWQKKPFKFITVKLYYYFSQTTYILLQTDILLHFMQNSLTYYNIGIIHLDLLCIGVSDSWSPIHSGQQWRPVPKVPDVGQIWARVGVGPKLQAGVDKCVVIHKQGFEIRHLRLNKDFQGRWLRPANVIVGSHRHNETDREKTKFLISREYLILWVHHFIPNYKNIKL